MIFTLQNMSSKTLVSTLSSKVLFCSTCNCNHIEMNIFKHNRCIYNEKYTALFTSAKSAMFQTALITVSQRS